MSGGVWERIYLGERADQVVKHFEKLIGLASSSAGQRLWIQ
jgi:hypothetical protein